MGETTGIAWTDATVNFWIGCTEVGTDGGCVFCYARKHFSVKMMKIGWGDDAPRHRTSTAKWGEPAKWNAMHERGQTTMRANGKTVPVPKWVFALSLGDFFDKVVPQEWRAEAWAVIRDTPRLRWQIVTKRLPLVRKMLPDDWNGGRGYEHVGIIATVVDQDELDRDLPRLVALKPIGIRWVGLSIEPQLGLVTFADHPDARKLDWVIGGGESQQGPDTPRSYFTWWSEVLIADCRRLGIPYFQKQVGSNAWLKPGKRLRTKHPRGEDPNEWPPHLRVRQMPRVYDDTMIQPCSPTRLSRSRLGRGASPDEEPKQ